MKEMILASNIILKRTTSSVVMLGAAFLLLAGETGLKAQTPFYQWNFNGVSGTGTPSITAGGGALATVIGAGNFTGVGLTSASTDWTYKGGGANDGVRSAANISGLGTVTNLTVTFWINPSVAWASQASTLGRFVMLGNSTGYDEGAGNGPGFSFAQNGGTALQIGVNSSANPVVANSLNGYAANQWVFVALEYDGGTANTNSSSALGASIGNSTANSALLLGTTTASIGSPTMVPLTLASGVAPGPITNTATMVLFVGNRNSGGRGFNGQIDNINIFTNLLTVSQLETLRISSYASSLTAGAVSSAANPITQGNTVTLSAGAGGGTAPYSFQWQTDGGSGTFTNIPGATSGTLSVNTTGLGVGNFQYQAVVTDSTTATVTTTPLVLNVIKVLSGTLTDLGTTAPVAGGSDAAQLTSAFTYQSTGGLNYYDNATPAMGQTFTTGSNAKGYSMNALAIQLAGGNSGTPAATANLTSAGMTNQAYDLRLYSVSGSTATMIADVTNLLFSFANTHWIQWGFPTIVLTNNATYAYTFQIRNTANYCGLATSDALSDHYAGGQMVAIPNGGGAMTFSSSANNDAAFDVGLIPNGVPFFLIPATATPNPAYALSPVKLACKPTTAGIYTYKWMSDDGSGNNLMAIPGATATNLTVIPPDLNPGGADYTTNYYFVATDTTSGNSVTSSVVALLVHAASAPQIAGLAPASLVTFVGDRQVYTVTDVGTLPLTNQWQFNNGSGFVSLTTQTNITLTLTNLQTSNSGTYQFVSTNLVGNSSASATLTVLPAPANPVVATQQYFNSVFTNAPWVYWRLNETNDPTAVGAPAYRAYDYSGHGFFATYGNAVTVNNPGPQTPSFPGFDANELAAGTTISTANAYLTAPALNLTGNSNVTFMAWINPNGAQAASTGLLFNRGGPDSSCGFGYGSTSDHLGYTWNNNSAATYNWDSMLTVADNQWNFVAYVITPTNTTIYLGNTAGGTTNFLQAVNPVANGPETFAGGTLRLGGDSQSINRNFNGLITEATLFTNALSITRLQQYFLTALGAAFLSPVATVSASPSATVYSGQNVLLAATISGSLPLTNQWQVSSDSIVWSNIAGATNATLVANPQTVGTLYYQISVANAGGSVTSSPVSATFTPLPSYPPGLWTASFEVTNNLDGSQNTGGGLGHYVGRGAVGNGTYWNILPQVLASGGGYGSVSIVSVSDLLDDGVTHSGVFCHMNSGGGYNGPGTTLPYSSDIGNLLGQWYRTYFSDGVDGNGALQMVGVPAGTYNLICYAGSGLTRNGSADLGSTYVVFDAVHGNQTNSTAAPSPVTALAEGVNFVTFTNVHASGTLNVDVLANAATGGGAIISGAQLQLVSYDPPTATFTGTPTNIFVTQTVVFTNISAGAITNAIWSFGDGSSVTNGSNSSVSHSYTSPGSYTVSLAVAGPGGGPITSTRTSYISVLPNPTVGSATLSGGKFVLRGANGPAGTQYRILTATNLLQPLSSWTPVVTNVFAPDGSYSYTNSSVTNAASFFRLVSP